MLLSHPDARFVRSRRKRKSARRSATEEGVAAPIAPKATEVDLAQKPTKAVPERAAHLGYEKHDPASHKQWQLAQWRDDEDAERGILGKCRGRRRAITTAATNRRSSVRGRRASPVSTTRSFRCMGAHERVRFRDTGKRPLVEVSPALIQCHRRNRGGRQDLAESAAGHLAQLAQAEVACRTEQAIRQQSRSKSMFAIGNPTLDGFLRR